MPTFRARSDTLVPPPVGALSRVTSIVASTSSTRTPLSDIARLPPAVAAIRPAPPLTE